LWVAVDEDSSGSDKGHEVVPVEAPPSVLGGVDELVGHGQGGGGGSLLPW